MVPLNIHFVLNVIADFFGNNIMGSFYATCSASRLTIKSGDDIVMMYVANIGAPVSRVTMNFGANWTPISFPIFGTYNGYGGIEPYDDDAGNIFLHSQLLKMLESTIKPSYRHPEGGFNAFNDQTIVGHQTLPDSWVTCFTRKKNVFIEHKHKSDCFELEENNGSQVTVIYYHRRVWNSLISNVEDPRITDNDLITDFIKLYKNKMDKFKQGPYLKMIDGDVTYSKLVEITSLEWGYHDDNILGKHLAASTDFSEGNCLLRQVRTQLLGYVANYLDTDSMTQYSYIHWFFDLFILNYRVFMANKILNLDFTPLCTTTHEANDHVAYGLAVDALQQAITEVNKNQLCSAIGEISPWDIPLLRRDPEGIQELIDYYYSDNENVDLVQKQKLEKYLK